MKIQLLFFGIAKDLAGKSSIYYDVKENTTVASLKASIITNYSGLKNSHEFAIAVNEEYADDEVVLKENDVVAIIPPVSGG
jgi:molybdopterin converting factor subunit 1